MPPILASKNPSKDYAFQDAFLETLFYDVMLLLSEYFRFGGSFEIQWAPKWDPKSSTWCQIANFQFYGNVFFCPDLLMHVAHPLVHFVTLLVPTRSLLIHF